jgi:ABC-2 type transport system ATP-binding protein
LNCIEIKNLSHRFSADESVLNNVDLSIPEGSIYGFIGPNGAGKTTAMKLILGLLKKQNGSVKIFGKEFDSNRVEILKQTGSLVEVPSLYAHLTATENLSILQKIYQCPKTRIRQVLEMVGLSAAAKKKAGKFSLGMKQRLAIAIALLPQPKLLILDEPVNGLDPAGIIEMRELLKKLNAEMKTTILISSHLLAEMEKLVNNVGIIYKGSMLFEGTLDDLHDKQAQSVVISFNTDNAEKAAQIFRTYNLKVTVNGSETSVPLVPNEMIAILNEQLVAASVKVFQIKTVKNDLESIFMDLTKN